MELTLSLEEIAALLQWRRDPTHLPTEIWEEIAILRLSFLPGNHPVFLHLIESVKRVWWQHFRCIQVKPSLFMFLPDARIKLRRAVLAHIKRRFSAQCSKEHRVACLEITFVGHEDDEKRMLQRTMNMLRVDPLREYVYQRGWGEAVGPLFLQVATGPLAVFEPTTSYTPCWCAVCTPDPSNIPWMKLTMPCNYFPNRLPTV